jgi:hypothetical protein
VGRSVCGHRNRRRCAGGALAVGLTGPSARRCGSR